MVKLAFGGCLTGAITALAALFSANTASGADVVDFSKGVFIINEDWFGHNNSTVNYLQPDAADGENWHYRVFKENNDGCELGTTADAGEIWNGKFYIICKQPSDLGGRINVADAKTLKVEYQISDINPDGSNVDARDFAGVDAHKGYVSSTDGVWILDLDNHKIIGQVDGLANGDASDAYHGQSGTMVRAAGKIFLAHQTLGLVVIDPSEDKVVDILSFESIQEEAGIGSVVVAKDGTLWCSVAASDGNAYPALLKVDPVSLTSEVVDVPSGIYAPANSWYAWTPDGFCASAVSNSLYWNGGSSSWFSGSEIFKYDIDSRKFSKIIDLQADGEGWQLYGCSMRMHPVTDELYMSLYQNFGSQSYLVRRYTADGEKLRDYPMIENYWFPAEPVFAQSDQYSGVANVGADIIGDIDIEVSAGVVTIRNGRGESVEIYSVSGSLLMSRSVVSDDFEVAPSLPAGIYIIKVGTVARKVRL